MHPARTPGAFPLLEPPEQIAGPLDPTLVTLDFDDDGLVDLADLANDGTLTLRRGTATGVGTPQRLALADADFPDIDAWYSRSTAATSIRTRDEL